MVHIRLISLLLVSERLLEADYFARRLARIGGHQDRFRYELNALLSAARSVTFLLLIARPGFFSNSETSRKSRGACLSSEAAPGMQDSVGHIGSPEIANRFPRNCCIAMWAIAAGSTLQSWRKSSWTASSHFPMRRTPAVL
jgi:hypothetical protein